MPQQMTMEAIHQARIGELIIVLTDEAGARDSIIRTSQALRLPYKADRTVDGYRVHISREEL